MTLTFLNLIVVSGILVGLIEASTIANRARYSSDILISKLDSKDYIQGSSRIEAIARNLPGVESVTSRYVESAKLENGYKTRTRETDRLNSTGGQLAGINPENENAVTGIASLLIDGQYLESGDTDMVMVGKDLLYEYSPIEAAGFQNLKDAKVGSKVRLVVNGNTREVTIKGVLQAKVGEIDQRIFMIDSQVRQLIGRNDFNVDEIAIKAKPGADLALMKQILIDEGAEKTSRVQLWDEAQPKFLKDIKTAFSLLGTIIGSIGLVVASITIFIVIFVNAVTRRKYIGILKGIGVNTTAIEFSYVVQAMFYALIGTIIGAAFVYGFLEPFIQANPIPFPFSDGILVAPVSGTIIRSIVLFIATAIAGYIPARLIIRQNTLDAILGR
jgi:putative ABC transport system permease protein